VGLVAAIALLTLVAAGCSNEGGDTDSTAETGGQTGAPTGSSGEDDGEIWSSASRTKMIDDPVGDSVPETRPFMDTVGYGVDRVRTSGLEGGTFLFRFEVAEPIPDSFEVPMGYDAAQYSFCLDTDPSTSPGGYPFANDDPVWCEFILTAVSDGGAWTGTLIDRRPLLDGGDAETPGVTFLTEDANGLFAVGADLLGTPRLFRWAMTASLLMLPLPSDDFIDLDANYEEMLTFER
jgi:hypothetical protein